MRVGRRGGMLLACLLAASAIGSTGAQEPTTLPGPQPAESAPAEPAPPPAAEAAPAPAQEEIHPDAVSSFLTRTYAIKPKKLWKELLEALADEGYPPEEVDDVRRHLKTSFIDFDAQGDSEPVVDAPPRFGPDYPIFQQVHVKRGKVSVEAIVAPEGRGSALSVRARILVDGLDRRRRARILTDRRSSGAIEKRLLAHLESRLALRPLRGPGAGS